jgi:hypothetical protein
MAKRFRPSRQNPSRKAVALLLGGHRRQAA